VIVRERPSGLRLFFVLRGSILKQIRWVMLANIGLAVLVTLSHGTLFHYKLQVTTIPFT
jgi:putative membrane protein